MMLGLLSLSSPAHLSPSLVSAKPIPSSASKASSFHGIRLQQLLPPPPLAARAAGAVMMAKREDELKEIRAKSTEELHEEIIDLKGELFMLRLQRSARNEFKSSEFRRMRKRVARMLTVKREREIEAGVGKRLSRKLDRQWKKSIILRPPPSLIKMQEEQKAKEAEKAT